ncbi:MAG: hypothetical protein OXL68_16000 [Paracoccaceae bacterium]|nr:hypothetical protein [Paracoccaceae bacterium]
MLPMPDGRAFIHLSCKTAVRIDSESFVRIDTLNGITVAGSMHGIVGPFERRAMPTPTAISSFRLDKI